MSLYTGYPAAGCQPHKGKGAGFRSPTGLYVRTYPERGLDDVVPCRGCRRGRATWLPEWRCCPISALG